MKRDVHVAVYGLVGAGKSTIVGIFMDALKDRGIEVTTTSLDDSPPPKARLNQIAIENTRVVLTEVRLRRQVTSKFPTTEERPPFAVQVHNTEEGGALLKLDVCGVVLEHRWPAHSLAVEKARMIAARLANELAVDVQDFIPTVIDRVQPR